LGHDAIAMEDYVATDRRPLQKCLADVAACDGYIGIFAWRYGFVPEADNSERRSITELELLQAPEGNRLLFLLDESAPWPRTKMDQGKDSNRIEDLRRRLCDNYTVSFFENAKHLEVLVTAAVSKLPTERYAKGEFRYTRT
jgi:hypothetical protein